MRVLSIMNRILITKYATKFTSYPVELLTICETNNVRLPKIDSLRGQAIALMTQPEIRGEYYVTREDTATFFKQIDMQTDDSIQPFNKDNGLKKKIMKGKYCVEYPFVVVKTHIQKRKDAAISGNRDEKIEVVKNFWRENLVDVPNELWQEGHLDPTIPDASENNLAFQPPLQARYRDRFKWDPFFHTMWPTVERELIPNIDKYYTEEEQKKLYNYLKTKFDDK